MPTLESHQNMALDAYQILKDGKVDTHELARLKRETLAASTVTDDEKRVLKSIFEAMDESRQSAQELEDIRAFREEHGI